MTDETNAPSSLPALLARVDPPAHGWITIAAHDDIVGSLHAELASLRSVAEAAKRYVRVLREWDADKNVMPLPPECESGACGDPCGPDGSRPAHNEWDHAEAHLVSAVDDCTRAEGATPPRGAIESNDQRGGGA